MAPRGRLAVIHNRPPWASMIDRQIASPIPMPCALVVNSGLNIPSMALGSTPFPVSSTDTITLPESWTSDLKESTRCPSSVAMESIAFVIKFTSTCCSCTWLPCIRGSHWFVVGLNGYPMRLQVVVHEGQSFADKIVDIERSPGPPIPLEDRPNILDHRAGTVPAGHDSL